MSSNPMRRLVCLLLFWEDSSRTGPESINRRRHVEDCPSTDSCPKCALKSLELPGDCVHILAGDDHRGLLKGVFHFVMGCRTFSLSNFNLHKGTVINTYVASRINRQCETCKKKRNLTVVKAILGSRIAIHTFKENIPFEMIHFLPCWVVYVFIFKKMGMRSHYEPSTIIRIIAKWEWIV